MTEPKRLTVEQLQELHFRLNGSDAGPWAPDYTLAKECGGRYWGNRLLLEIHNLTSENERLAKALDGAKAHEYEAATWHTKFLLCEDERDSALAQAARYREAIRVSKEISEQYFPDDTHALHALKVEIPDICERALAAENANGDKEGT